MKKIFALPLAVLFFAACSESTAPANTTADLTPSYAKRAPQDTAATGTKYTNFYDFNALGIAATNSDIATDTPDGSFSLSSAEDIQYAPGNTLNGFIGRYTNTNTRVLLEVKTPGSKYTVDFDLYIIGSWDGKGIQNQHGVFGENGFQVAYRCGTAATAAVVPLFTTTFSNQYTVQQDFPKAYGLGGYKAGTGSVAGSIDALGYKDRQDLSNTPSFRSFGDVTYHLTYTIANVCSEAAPTFVFSGIAPTPTQSTWDESWGLDNITLKVDS